MNRSLEDQLNILCASVQGVKTSRTLLDRLPNATREQVIKNERRSQVFAFRYTLKNAELTTGFLVAPKRIKASLPVVIYNRGGTADFGLINTVQMMTELATIASWGYVVIGSQYTGNSLSGGKDEWGGADLDSVEQLKQIIDRLDCVDSTRIYMLGGSRGALMTYMLLRKVNWIKAVASIAGVSDVKSFISFRKDMRDIFREIGIDSVEEYDRRSVLKWANEIPQNIPVLLFHGKQDDKVPFEQSVKLYELLKYRKNVEFLPIEDAGHNLTFVDARIETLTTAWLSKL